MNVVDAGYVWSDLSWVNSKRHPSCTDASYRTIDQGKAHRAILA